MTEPIPHPRVEYPAEYALIEPRELARRSQTNFTDNPLLGLQYAVAANDRGHEPAVAAADPTLAGEAAAKAAFRSAQLDRPASREYWIARSLEDLPDNSQRMRRERVATYLLAGRARGFNVLQSALPTLTTESLAKQAFVHGEQTLKKVPSRDPYGVVLAKHHAAFEAVRPNGKTLSAVAIATRSIARSILARQERSKLSERSFVRDSADHFRFIGKQLTASGVAFGLALSRPFDRLSAKLHDIRHKTAVKILG